MSNYWVLAGILVVVIGFALKFNPLLIVTVSAIVTGLIAGLTPIAVIAAFGKAFNDNRYISVVWIILPLIGLLERYGLQERARTIIQRFRGATSGRLLIAYMVFRQLTAALGLTSVAGHAQTVRPLVAPMAEAADEKNLGTLDEAAKEQVRALAAATDNVGVFFGEDIFVAVASILLIQGVMQAEGIALTPLQLSVWAIPTAICAFLIHGARLLWRDHSMAKART